MKVTLVNKKEVEEMMSKIGWQGCVSAGLDPEKVQEAGMFKIAKTCIESGHLSVTRPALFTFRIEGVSRALSHQFVRENVGVFIVQESQRYVKMEEPDFVIPPSIEANPSAKKVFVECMNTNWMVYKLLCDMGIPAEDARFAIPNAATTKIHVSLSYEALLRIAGKRCCNRAQWEIRAMVIEMCRQVRELNEYLGSKLVAKCETIGYCTESRCCGKYPTKNEFFKTYARGLSIEGGKSDEKI